ncbi:MAG: exo-alpha-sialidase [Bryobacteraceae bacterium]|nr:exo-alpha-sialidase [Bryobacteraceae bacterium]MDW8378812.1 sialidase family protein [Bryobacterales bacterium]
MLRRDFVASAVLAPVWARGEAESATAFVEIENIFPLDIKHNHASCIVELPNGDLLTCWYRGSGERSADDVQVLGARKRRGSKQWTAPFLLADQPGFPDTNPCLFVDSRQRLWLIWQTIIANEWHTALTQYRITTDWDRPLEPRWQVSEPLLFIPRNFVQKVTEALEPMTKSSDERTAKWAADRLHKARDRYFSRMGWMTRAHPVELPSGRIIVPLYSDGYDFSIMAITDDGGRSWTSSDPLPGFGNIQPTIARRKNGVLVAYMRDNGPPPKRLHVSESRDDGLTWSPVQDTDIPNPGSGAEVIVLKDGSWLLINNDLERGRHDLVVRLSDDEGRSWKWKRSLEVDNRAQGPSSFHYPSVVQSRDGLIHASYSYFLNHLPATAPRKTIRHAVFNQAWVKGG